MPTSKRLQQDCRDDLARMGLTGQIQRLLLNLTTGYKPVYALPAPPKPGETPYDALSRTVVTHFEELSRTDIARMTLQLKVLTSALNKIVPDLKSIEVRDETEERKALDEKELSRRIAGVLSMGGDAATVSGERERETARWMN